MKFYFLLVLLISSTVLAQRVRQEEHHAHSGGGDHNHLAHIQAYRQETVYVHNLPAPQLLKRIGSSNLKIKTSSAQAQAYFSQGVALLHCFWDFEAYRAFKEAIRLDSAALMPYWGLYSAIGAIEGDDFTADKLLAIQQLKNLKETASEHEKLYADAILARDEEQDGSKKEYQKKLELIIHKYPQDIDAKLFLALSKMGGYDAAMNPREGQLYAEYLLRDLLKNYPENAAAHHYWIHLMENCCPEQALESSVKLPTLAPASGHMVHMPGHVYYKLGDYKKAYDAFAASLAVDSVYMKEQGIAEVDAWNYIHNINYLLSNCAEDGRYATALVYAEKLKNMPATKERKRKYEGRFFYQGVIAPAKMELCFGFYKKAADRLAAIRLDQDSLYTTKAIAYKDALYYFASGMHAVKSNKIADARKCADALDASLWRNSHQLHSDDIINTRRLNDLNVASLELQGVIKSAENNYNEAVALLEKAKQKEDDLGYSEPPSYARPVLISLAETHLKARQYDKAIKAYEQLLERHPNTANGLWGLYKVYKQKGDSVNTKKYAALLAQVVQYGDKTLYPL
ncbi:tetratricopeptide repeat protein [Cytophagaceae bacterium YF14B1]|uniref:Tetratricopeptide repeat protein n=1 Tax=Xanthocytophaga flava TaxID=3048013 RepID=A0AAE3QWF1_9BACT|nr:tetratricopeptide repeat protein [Xanthocytophaga flavus]MDJ1486261.1 tetratricopeptide repeat protein [Xanthocytophaga flavus]